MPKIQTVAQSSSHSRRSFLQTVGLAVITCAHGLRAEQATRSANRIPFKGIVPAALTPFDAELRIALKEFRRHLEALSAVSGVTAIMVNGGAGQDGALTRDERRSLLAEAVAAVGSRTPIIAALRETKDIKLEDLAKDAVREGADALLIMPPPDKHDAAWDGARVRFQKVFNAADKPVAFYQVSYSTETLTQLAEMPSVFAIKEGSGDPVTFERNMRSARALGRKVAIWSTQSRWLLADLAVGADGILSGMGSIAADLHVALAEAVGRSDLAAARRVNDRLYPLTQVFYGRGGDPHTRMKYALARLGRWEHDYVRPPLKPLDDTERSRVDRALQESGLFR